MLFDYGSTTLYASRFDARFSWLLYVPPDIHDAGPAPELIVSVHGSNRTAADYRDFFAEFARWNRCVVLAPLFPAGVRGDGDRHGYKYVIDGDIRYDAVLLGMVAEVEEKYGLSFPRFALWGFSGGGHFAHRFLLLHPERLWAASIGAPGSVTLLDPDRDWWAGTRGMAALFGREPDIPALRAVAVHMVVGGADLETWEITHRPGTPRYVEGANAAGATRPERLDSLRRSFEAAGIAVAFDLVPGVAHTASVVVRKAQDFLFRALAAKRQSDAKTADD
ncbi:alpha/beta hydrolase [Methylobacterium crusticola]|nr:alpha/beta hydrolase [Methylobacterium crusticola]